MRRIVILVGRTELQPRQEIVSRLRQSGYMVQLADDFHDALAVIPTTCPDVIVLFLNQKAVPASAWEVIRVGRRAADAAVVVLTSSQAPKVRVAVLQGGADACLAVPVSPDVLLACIDSLVRRRPRRIQAGKAPFVLHDLYVDFHTREVRVRGERKNLTPQEFDLLAALIDCSQSPVADDRKVLETVFPEASGNREILRQYIWRLRCKIEPDPRAPQYILHDPESGYRLGG